MQPKLFSLLFSTIFISTVIAQPPARTQPPATPASKEATTSSTANKSGNFPKNILDVDAKVEKNNEVTIKGKSVKYKVTAGTRPIWDKDGEVIAGIFYTFYERTDVDKSTVRPIVFSFNGGPGSASVWMMLGYTGPKLLHIDEEGNPLQPYGLKDNPYSILDVADIVYVDPVNTGFSRPLGKSVSNETFFGVNADITYLAEWINSFVNKNKRWASPKYLIGESYGTTRVSGLAMELQSRHWMYLNGVILVSPTDLGIKRDGPVADALTLPYYAATAWYHKKLSADLQQKDLVNMLPEVEQFTINEYIPALTKGSQLTDVERNKIIEKVSKYSGLSAKVVKENNLKISTGFFWKELLRDRGFTVGRLDSRYLGLDLKDAGNYPEYNSELVSWLHSFTPAINLYLRDELGYETNLKYNMFGSVYPWNNERNTTGYNLASAMAQNPYLHVLVQSGYYDGACDYFSAQYNMWQLDISNKLKNRISWEGYRSGHMMYLRKEDLAVANEHIRSFIIKSTPAKTMPAKY
ncbi:MAG TPA: carboxypeptidase [Chitinophagaceae bacterium]|nr:carboxypeptidase [Chitinophagaceae bacterium]MCC6635276.1 carboxypeptidase [Chitinophagaceae bacterium]HMZ46218.1 carboxypeptidase [Chitinophagaceae bacterium]HNF29439.1 carboxypeptidase [Chitinophagaceae bacterium]HNL82217.1 carboxypeptidase [Chitinophagaceae bacterium]